MALLSWKMGHLTGWSGRASGTVPEPASPEAHASRRGAAPRAASAPSVVPRKDLRVSFLGAPWPCQPSLGCAMVSALVSGTYGLGEFSEVRDQAVYIRLIVLHRDQPLLDLAPRRQENPAVVLVEPVRVAVPVVHAEEAAVVGHRVGGEHHAALGAGGDYVGGEAVVVYRLADALGGALAQVLDGVVGLRGGYLGQHVPRGGPGQGVPV